jgi:hypothetical protein
MNRYLWVAAFALLAPFIIAFNADFVTKVRFTFLILLIGFPGILLGDLLVKGSRDRAAFLGIGLWVLLSSFLLWISGLVFGNYRIGYVLLAVAIGALFVNRRRFKD